MAHHDKIIEGRIDELIELIDNSQIPRFGSADRRIVNADEIAGILVEIKSCLPENVRKANDVLARANKIMLEADEYSNATKADADRIAQDTVEKQGSMPSRWKPMPTHTTTTKLPRVIPTLRIKLAKQMTTTNPALPRVMTT